MARTGDHHRGRAGVSPLEALVRALLALLVAVTASGCATAARQASLPVSRVDLAIVTWNMHVGAGDLERLVGELADGRLTGTTPVDYVLLLQEVTDAGPHNPTDVARDRGLSVVFEGVRIRGSRTSGNAILSTLPLMNTRQIELPLARQRRAALLTATTLAGENIFIANAHFENRVSIRRGLLFSDGARGRQARALIDVLPAGHGIAGGDLNTWLGPDEPAWKAFAARFPDTPAGRPQPTVRNRLVLDHLFFDVPDGWVIGRRVLPDDYGSDHHPVLGTIRVSF